MVRHHWIQFTFCSIAALMISGCGDTASKTSEARLSDFWSELEGCALCHSPQGEQAEGPDLSTSTDFVKNLVNKSAADYPNWAVTGTCSSALPYIQEGNSTKSTLLAALVKEDSDAMEAKYGCFSSYNIHAVNQVEIKQSSALYNELVRWIDAGAKNN